MSYWGVEGGFRGIRGFKFSEPRDPSVLQNSSLRPNPSNAVRPTQIHVVEHVSHEKHTRRQWEHHICSEEWSVETLLLVAGEIDGCRCPETTLSCPVNCSSPAYRSIITDGMMVAKVKRKTNLASSTQRRAILAIMGT
jgi:hypothetical protein